MREARKRRASVRRRVGCSGELAAAQIQHSGSGSDLKVAARNSSSRSAVPVKDTSGTIVGAIGISGLAAHEDQVIAEAVAKPAADWSAAFVNHEPDRPPW